MEQANASAKSVCFAACGTMMGDAAAGAIAETAFSFPSVPFSVDFSTWVALRERR